MPDMPYPVFTGSHDSENESLMSYYDSIIEVFVDNEENMEWLTRDYLSLMWAYEDLTQQQLAASMREGLNDWFVEDLIEDIPQFVSAVFNSAHITPTNWDKILKVAIVGNMVHEGEFGSFDGLFEVSDILMWWYATPSEYSATSFMIWRVVEFKEKLGHGCLHPHLDTSLNRWKYQRETLSCHLPSRIHCPDCGTDYIP